MAATVRGGFTLKSLLSASYADGHRGSPIRPHALPPGMTTTGRQPALTAEEQAALDRARRLSRVLDEAVAVPGTNYRIGLDPLLGIAPVSGDAVAALGSLYIVATGLRLGLPRSAAATMLGLIAVEFVVGSIPIVGPIIDAHWKVNRRNVDRLEAYLADRAGDAEPADRDPVGSQSTDTQ